MNLPAPLPETLNPSALGVWAQAQGSFWLPPASSTTADSVDRVFYLIFWISVFFFVLIAALLVIFTLRYRRREGVEPSPSPSHNTTLEIIWSVIPLIIVIVIFYEGFVGFMDLRTPPSGAYEIRVTANNYDWFFKYPNGYIDENLHVPVGQPVRLLMSSGDFIHSLYVPAFRVKMDVVPGRYSTLWFHARDPGEYNLLCAEYCGLSHSDMTASVVVHEPGEFEPWLNEASNLLATMSPVDAGRELFRRRACATCHSIDGTASTGPTFKGIFGETHRFSNAPDTLVDENYLRESILEPAAKVREGFQAQMSTFAGLLKDEEIDAVIEYIKSLQ